MTETPPMMMNRKKLNQIEIEMEWKEGKGKEDVN